MPAMADTAEFKYDVFISYSSRDKGWVRDELLVRIEQAGLQAFIDFRDFSRGAPSIKEMERGIIQSRKTLVVLTPAYIESEWCEIETLMLQTLSPSNRDLRLIPLLRTPCAKPLHLEALTHVDLTETADSALGWHQLLSSLEAGPTATSAKPIPVEVQAELDAAKQLIDRDRFAEAIPILQKALAIADAENHALAKVKARISLAQALYEAREDFKGAESSFRSALVLVPISDHDLKHSVLHGLGDMLLFSGRLDEATATIHAALDAAKLTGKVDDLAGILVSLGLLERALGFYEKSLVKFDEAIQLLLKNFLSAPTEVQKRNAHILAACYINKALLCRDAGGIDEALSYYGKAEEQHQISGDKLDAGRALLFRGELHCGNADWQDGFKCFDRAFEYFKEIDNPLWGARALEHISRLFATHERWGDALRAMLGAATGAKEADHPGEQVHFLCMTARLVQNWKEGESRKQAARLLHKHTKDLPDDAKSEATSRLYDELSENRKAIEMAVRDDREAREFLNQAKEIARNEELHQHLANCLLQEAHHMTRPDDTTASRNLQLEAINLLKKELAIAQSPKKRGHLMGRIGGIYQELDNSVEALLWLKRAGDLFEKSGDAYGLANFYTALAHAYRAEDRLDDEIEAYRKVLSIIEGRSFHEMAAGARINLAAALRYRQEFDEAQRLLNDAETLCERHGFKEFVSAIARNRSYIERERQASQAPAHTLSELLDSLGQLLRFRPDLAVAYLPFWYSTFQTELMSLARSGPLISLMVLTDDVQAFLNFSLKFRGIAHHFLMATTREPTIKVDAGVLPIPRNWLFPANFTFVGVRRSAPILKDAEEISGDGRDDEPPDVRLVGPAAMMPLYTLVSMGRDDEGDGHVASLSSSHLPQEAVDLMVKTPTDQLIERRAAWLPTDRYESKDPFLTDLRIARQRGLFPVYFAHFPISDGVRDRGGVKVYMPESVLSGHKTAVAERWRRALLKLTKLPRSDVDIALLDIPELFDALEIHEGASVGVEIRLFEFSEIGKQRAVHPAILIQIE
jgi:tetratricopeptide (TPR) repeat protein